MITKVLYIYNINPQSKRNYNKLFEKYKLII